MTTVFLILFFLSLSGIILMVGNKLILLQEGQLGRIEHVFVKMPDAQEIKHIVVNNTKKYGFIALVITLRFTILSSHFIKNKYKLLKNKIHDNIKKYTTHKNIEVEKKEVSGFLKTISEYKHKIRKIKHKIKEQEGIE